MMFLQQWRWMCVECAVDAETMTPADARRPQCARRGARRRKSQRPQSSHRITKPTSTSRRSSPMDSFLKTLACHNIEYDQRPKISRPQDPPRSPSSQDFQDLKISKTSRLQDPKASRSPKSLKATRHQDSQDDLVVYRFLKCYVVCKERILQLYMGVYT